MKLFGITSAVLVSNLATLIAAASIELTPDNIKEKLQSGTWLIEHFSPQCPHCINFAPEWKKLSDDLDYLAKDANFHFGTIDCSTRGDLCDEHDILRYPTVQLWEGGEKTDTYSGLNKYDPLTEYILNKINSVETENKADEVEENNEEEEGEETEAEEEAEEEQGEEVELDDAEQPEEEQTEEDSMGPEIFEDIIEEDEQVVDDVVVEAGGPPITPNPNGISLNLEGKQMREIASGRIPWFIKFYAPWCPHCQRLAPTWKDMAAQLRNQVNVGEVNCDAVPSVCQEYNIRGYPTLQMYGHGSPIQYAGDRTLPSLLKFAHAHSGPSVREIQYNELEQEVAEKGTIILYLHDETQNEVPESLSAVAEEYALYSSQDSQLLQKYNLSPSDLPSAVIIKGNSYRIYRSHDFSDREEIIGLVKDINKAQTDNYTPQSTQTSSGLQWAYSHWFLSLVGLGAIGSVVYKYANSPKVNSNVLPTHRSDYSHKD